MPKVLDLASGGMSAREIASLFPVSLKTVYRWVSTFADESPQFTPPMNKKEKSDSMSGKDSSIRETDVEILRARIKELESQLTMAEIKAEAYDEMINVAESKFRIRIRKKAGAKQ